MLWLDLSFALASALQAPEHDSARTAPPSDTRGAGVVVAGGPVEVVPLDALDDSVPLPTPAVIAPGEHGDRLVAPASGDPFFLGFAAGAYFPPASERIDPELVAQTAVPRGDGRPAPDSYAFAMLSARITDARVAELEALGCRVLGFHPHYALKLALPPHVIEAVAALSYVRWIGVPRTWQKLHPDVAAALPGAAGPVDLWINVYESDLGPSATRIPVGVGHEADAIGNVEPAQEAARPFIVRSNGWQQRALEALGAEIVEYVDEIRAFRVRIDATGVEALVQRDFVQFVEPATAPQALHDESMALVNADRGRASYDGTAALVGVLDSGMNFLHNAIDPYVVGWEYSTDGTFYWDDQNGHGTHVSGTILGNGDIEDSYAGAAPGVGPDTAHRVFVAKMLNAAGSGAGVSLSAVYTQMRTPYTDSNNVTTPRPMITNNSYGTPGSTSYGTEADARLIDDTVYDWDQLYVFAAGNSGSGGNSVYKESGSKNAFTVGSVYDWDAGVDPGNVATSSSRGPTDDGRWKPNLVAPGNLILSCDAFDTNGYVTKTGTSMAAPHVAGIAAQLCDRHAFLRYNPATLSAVMMAGSITKNDAVLTTPSTDPGTHLNIYGTGRIDAHKAAVGDSQQSLYFWGYGQGTSGYGQLDFAVSSGATRVTVVMHYKEESASAGGSAALVNDLDMYLDVEPFSAGGNTGEYSAHQSPRDNTEIRILNSPTVGNWRIKVFPDSVVAGQTCKVGVCAIVTYGDTTPDANYAVTTSDAYVQVNQNTSITASYTNPSYIASAVYLDSTSSGDALQSVVTQLEDGALTELTSNAAFGRDVLLGNVLHGTNRYATWWTRWVTEGVKTFSVEARSDNALDETDAVTIWVDSTPPPVVTNLVSTTHTPLVWSNDATIAFQWTQPADNVSGVDGYSWTLLPTNGLPDAIKDVGAVTSYVTNFDPQTDTGTWWFSIRPVDKCGNWAAGYTRVGPFFLDFIQPAYVTGLTSPSHAVGSSSCNATVTMTWDPTADSGGSGLAGYAVLWSHVADQHPDPSLQVDIGNVTSYVETLAPSAQPWYFHITPIDNAGNGQNHFNFGPIYVVPAPSSYCTGKVNSLGCTPSISSVNAPSKSAGNFTVMCSSVINNRFGLLFWGDTAIAAPFQGGTLCVDAPVVRTPIQDSGGTPPGVDDCSGTWSFTFDTGYMNAYSIDPGDTRHAQWWGRDPQSPSTTSLSNAIQFTVCE